MPPVTDDTTGGPTTITTTTDADSEDTEKVTKKKRNAKGVLKVGGKFRFTRSKKSVHFPDDTTTTSKKGTTHSTPHSLIRVDAWERVSLYHNSEHSAVLAAEDSIDIDLALQNTNELMKVQLEPDESRWVEDRGKKIGLIKSLGRGRAVIYIHADHATRGEDMAYIAGHVMREDAFVTDEGKLTYKVSVRSASEKDFLNKANAAIYSNSLQLGNKPKEFSLICACSGPFISEEHAERIGKTLTPECMCGDRAHPECLPNPVALPVVDENSYTCTPCHVRELEPGLQWAARAPAGTEQVTNTCPVDNFLTGLSIFTNEQNPDLEKFFPDEQQHDNLKETLRLVRNKEYNKAQTNYYNECKEMNDSFMARPENIKLAKEIKENAKLIKEAKKKNKDIEATNKKIEEVNKKHPKHRPAPLEKLVPVPPERVMKKPITALLNDTNLWGETFTRVNDKHLRGFEVIKVSSCSNPDCSNHTESAATITPIELGPYINNDNNITGVNDLQLVTQAMEQQCQECNLGLYSQKDFVVTEDNWALSFNATSIDVDRRHEVKCDILNGKLPDTITIKNTEGNEQVYGLASISLQDGNHFVSVHYIPNRGEFVYYDGMTRPQIRKMHPSDLMDPERKLNSIEYYRLT